MKAEPKGDGCTCGNLVYEPSIVGNTGHMMNCPVMIIRRLEERIRGMELGKGDGWCSVEMDGDVDG